MKNLILIIRVMAATVLLVGWAGTSVAQETLVIGQVGDAITLDPHANNGIVEASMASNIFDPMIILDKDMAVQPGIAVSWEAKDPVTWNFGIRKGVKFHDGTPLTAEDVKFSIDRILNWKSFGAMGGIKAYITPISSVRVIDQHTVEVKTVKPWGPILSTLRVVFITSKAHVEKVTKEKGVEAVSLNPMGSGAYKLIEWVPGDHLTMEANQNWWGGKPAVKTITFRQISNYATRVAALLSGEIHIATGLPVRDVKRVESNSATKVTVLDGMRTVNYKFDTTRDVTPGVPDIPNPFKKRKVRMAMNHAINSEAIIKVVMNGFARPATQLAGDKHLGWNPTIERLPYDPEKARQLLKEAGYPNGFKLRIDSTNNRYINDEAICLTVAQMINKVGVKATCRARPKQVVFKEIYDPKILCCSMFVFSFVTPTGDIAGNMESNFHTPTELYGGYNGGKPEQANYSNAAADLLIEAASAETDYNVRKTILQAASTVIMHDYPIVPLHYQNDIYGMSTKVNWTPRPDMFLTMFDAKWH